MYSSSNVLCPLHRHLEGVLDERSAAIVVRFLASSRALSKSFDMYLQQVGLVSSYVCQWVNSNQYYRYSHPHLTTMPKLSLHAPTCTHVRYYAYPTYMYMCVYSPIITVAKGVEWACCSCKKQSNEGTLYYHSGRSYHPLQGKSFCSICVYKCTSYVLSNFGIGNLSTLLGYPCLYSQSTDWFYVHAYMYMYMYNIMYIYERSI